MGAYIILNDGDVKRWSTVQDSEVNELLQEARMLDDSLLISEHTIFYKNGWFSKGFFKKVYSIRFNTGHREARIVNFASDKEVWFNEYVSKETATNYLYGFITGAQRIGSYIK